MTRHRHIKNSLGQELALEILENDPSHVHIRRIDANFPHGVRLNAMGASILQVFVMAATMAPKNTRLNDELLDDGFGTKLSLQALPAPHILVEQSDLNQRLEISSPFFNQFYYELELIAPRLRDMHMSTNPLHH